MNSQRRSFIVATSAAAFAVLSERLPGIEPVSSARDELLARVLEALHHFPKESPVADKLVHPLLASVLGTTVDGLDSYALASSAQLKRQIQDTIVADYQQRRLRVIDGWWLSDTEAGCLELVSHFSRGSVIA